MPHKKHTLLILSAAFLFLLSCVGAATDTNPAVLRKRPKPQISVPALERRIHALINEERRKAGLPFLAWDDSLGAIARKHSKDMETRNYFDHYSPEGHDFLYRYREEGYRCGIRTGRTLHLGAENLALNNLYDSVTTVNGEAFYDWNSQEKLAETTVRGWMKSPGHRQNILTPYWLHEGIGVVISPDGKVYITQNFC